MSTYLLYTFAGGLLFVLALYGAISARHLLRKIMALNIMGSGIFLLLISVARRNMTEVPDPVPHAMVLTGIVVTLAVTAFALSIARRIYTQTGRTTLSPDEESE
jgi:multicomponent Na+:H+ antiporter subunit C